MIALMGFFNRFKRKGLESYHRRWDVEGRQTWAEWIDAHASEILFFVMLTGIACLIIDSVLDW